jgi:hypothetical protein
MRHRLSFVLAIAVLLLGGSAVTAAASAARPDAHARHHHRYCVAEATRAGSTRVPAMACYHSFARSVRVATSGRVRLPASATPRSVTPDELNAGAITPNTSYVLSIDYQNSNYGGNTFVWYQSSKCGSFQSASMPTGWNDVVSSVKAESGCATTLFWNNNFGSPTYPITKNGSAASLGVFNDETSSQSWCPTYPCGP